MSVVSSVREARAVLLAVDPFVAAQWVGLWGPVEALERVGRDPGHRARLAGLSAGEILDAGAAVGAVLLTPEDEGWPVGLGGLVPVPVGVWVRGPVGLLGRGPVTVTGSRACTRYGESVAGELGLGLAEVGVPVCTGGGFGIDAAATRGALAGGGPVVLVGAAGVDLVYQAAHTELVARVLDEGGVLVTVTSPGQPPSRARFIARHRVMAALSRSVVVVEAAVRSGVRDVAHTATMCGVPVGAVPGPIGSVTSAGCHQLLSDGARIITSLRDVLALTGEDPHRG